MGNKSVLVTGASKGIGRAVAIEFAKRGYYVGINYNRSKDAALNVQEEVESLGQKAICIKANISHFNEINPMVDTFLNEFGRVDVLINNAGISEFMPILEVSEEFFDKVISTDFKGAFFTTQCVAKSMIKSKISGSIVNISSNHIYACWPDASIYAAGKAALSEFTKHAAMELAKYKIRVNAVAPGYTKVGRTQRYDAMKRIPMQRFASPEEMAKLIYFVAGEENSYMTGSIIKSDGGALLPSVTDNEYISKE